MFEDLIARHVPVLIKLGFYTELGVNPPDPEKWSLALHDVCDHLLVPRPVPYKNLPYTPTTMEGEMWANTSEEARKYILGELDFWSESTYLNRRDLFASVFKDNGAVIAHVPDYKYYLECVSYWEYFFG